MEDTLQEICGDSVVVNLQGQISKPLWVQSIPSGAFWHLWCSSRSVTSYGKPWVCADKGECRDGSYLRTEVWDRHRSDILTLLLILPSQETRTSSYNPHDQPSDNPLGTKYLLSPVPASTSSTFHPHLSPTSHTSLWQPLMLLPPFRFILLFLNAPLCLPSGECQPLFWARRAQ